MYIVLFLLSQSTTRLSQWLLWGYPLRLLFAIKQQRARFSFLFVFDPRGLGMRFPPLFSSFSASFSILTSLLGLWRDAETLFIRQGDRFSSPTSRKTLL